MLQRSSSISPSEKKLAPSSDEPACAQDSLKYPIEGLCRLLGVSKQAYFQRDEDVQLRRLAQEEFALSYILDVRKKDPGIGGMKLWYMYKGLTGNYPMGRDRFVKLIDRYNLKVRKRRRKPRTTDSTHGLPVYPNLVRNFIPTAPQPAVGKRYYLYPYMAGRRQLLFLLLVADTGCIYGGNRRLERRTDP